MSGHYYFSILKSNKTERTLILDFVYEKGDISFFITDSVSGETKELNNPASGKYEFRIEKGHSYKVKIISKKVSGKYSFRIKE